MLPPIPEEQPIDPAMMGAAPPEAAMMGAIPAPDPAGGIGGDPLAALLVAVQAGWAEQEAEVSLQQDALLQTLMQIAQAQQGPAPAEVFSEGAPISVPSDTMPPEAPDAGMGLV